MTGSLAARRAQEKQARYNAILDAAETVFAAKGYERTSMDDIARSSNLSRALLYVYFKDKAAIQQGIILRAAEALWARFEAAKQSAHSGLDQLSAIGRAYYQFYREQPDYFAALTTAAAEGDGDDPKHAEQLKCSESRVMDTLIAAIRAGLDDGTLNRARIRDPLETALYLRGALHGVILLCQRDDNQALIEHTLAMLMSSIASTSR
ncbi:TetR/AcrR family transcriptional regulator [Marinobacter sp. X15-166B]|uniref:TetR/AcrR family transcriptional regulator n=1 Tax=Marinobacter sp. X15-166B TaxID=1897620 RepID=UPI00085C2CAA|nr:TetR/AcrR family transcriptional regulator [Marinobacter sp. X15-166B]OEY65588.1 TetR family transcriptional regulator [Marinobacter sp. X15-166B]